MIHEPTGMTSNHSVFGGVGVIMSEASVNPLKGRGHKLPLPLQYVSVALSGPQGKVAALKHLPVFYISNRCHFFWTDIGYGLNIHIGPFGVHFWNGLCADCAKGLNP